MASNRKPLGGLGRSPIGGLDMDDKTMRAIFSGDEDPADLVSSQISQIPLSQIESCSTQPRKFFDDDALQELADSIAEHGIIQPIAIRKLSSGYYQIIAGERRWRAARMAGLHEVPALVIQATDQQAAILALIENLHREDLNPMEEAEGYQALIEQHHLTQEEAAQQVGKSRSAIANSLRLLKLDPVVRALVEDGSLSEGHARTLLPLSPDDQELAARKIIENELSVRQTEALVKKLIAGAEDEGTPVKAPGDPVDYRLEAQKNLSNHLGRGVKIVSGKKKGRIELEYYGMDDLNDLLDALAQLRGREAERTPNA